jgi:anti-sigma factor RsiW
MSTTNTTQPSEHPSDLLLSYLDDQIVTEDKLVIQEHIQSCPQCAQELQRLDHLTHLLKVNKEAFCPEPWELFQCVENLGDSEDKISAHLAQCPACQEEVVEYSSRVSATTMPERLMAEMKRQFPERSSDAYPQEERRSLSALIDQMKGLFSIPVMALGTAAAALIVVVMLLPPREAPLVIGLSSVAWKTERQQLVPKAGIRLMGPGKQGRHVAVVLLIKDAQLSRVQDEIDQIYRALKPTDAMERQFHMVSPDKMREALDGMNIKPFDRREIVESLRDRLGVSDVLLITVSSKGNGFEVRNELLDAKTGLLIYKTAISPVAEANLTPEIRDSAFSVLNTLVKAN